MDEDAPNPQPSPNSQNVQSSTRDAPRYHGNHRRNTYSQQAPRPTEKPQESKDLSPDDEETEQDRSSAPSRHSRGGGRGKPPKRVIEEWANDIYCE